MKFPRDPQLTANIERAIDALLPSEACRIGNFVKSGKYKECVEQGIYAITDPGDDKIVYIGKTNTRKGGVGRRVRQHVSKGRTLQKKLKVDGINDYHVRVHPMGSFADPLSRQVVYS
jgi:hypothetical protein